MVDPSVTQERRPARFGNLHPPRVPALPKEIFVPSDRYAYVHSLRIILVLFSLLFLASLAYREWSVLGLLAVAPFVGAYIYKLTFILHECAHYTFFKRRRTNVLVGTITAALLGTSFRTYKNLHWEHHRLCGMPEDPLEDDHDILGLAKARFLTIVFHLLQPLSGVTAIDVIKEYVIRPTRNDWSGGQDRKPKSVGEMYRQLAAIVGAQLLIAATATHGFSMLELVWYYPFCAGTIALFLSRLRGFCEHVPIGAPDGKCFVRTHTANLLDKLFFYDLNFNYHLEHHYYPAVPACHLPKVHGMIRETLHSEKTISRSILGTLMERLRHTKECGRSKQ